MSYISDIRNTPNLTIKDIIRVATPYLPLKFRNCAWGYCDSEGRTLNHGKTVLETEEQCNAYMVAYGNMHTRKLERALDEQEFPYSQVSKGLELFDWGCGQGIGTLAIIDALRRKGLLQCLKKITLEEPSDIARSRAVLHVEQALGNDNVEIVDVADYLPSDLGDDSNSITSIEVTHPCAVHIFSNILDMEAVSLKGVSKLITSSGSRHLVLCIGPACLNESRINSFINYFKNSEVCIFTNFRDTNFGRHPNGKPYGCLIKSFSFLLSQTENILHKYKYFAPIQLFACYSEKVSNKRDENSAFEILAPFDMTAHRNLCPVYALLSNLISRGYHTYPSRKVLDALLRLDSPLKILALVAISRIQKTFVELLISERIDIHKAKWNILILEDETNVAHIAIEDFYELYNHLIALTEDYDQKFLPSINLLTKQTANHSSQYDAIIDVSISQYCNPEKVKFSEYKAINDCYFIIRSSQTIYEDRTFYTTERIKYKSLVTKDGQGNYQVDEEICRHLRYFLNLIFRKYDFRSGQLPILSRALQLKSVIGLLPTGGGKSLTYQLAAMLQPAVTLVVDPLKGLMKDQYDGLLDLGIDCISYINTDVTDKRERELQLTGSQIQIMFLSPERLSIHRFREVLRSMRESDVYFAYGVIDEVHCVSEWGHDFRLAYLHLGRNLYNYVLPKEVEDTDNHISLFGLTATASFDVLADVERELSGTNAYSLEDDATVRYENTNRLELQYYVSPVNADDVNKARDVGEVKEEELLNVINDATSKVEEIQAKDCVNNMKKRFLERENISDQRKIEEINDIDLAIPVERKWYSKADTHVAGIVFCPRASSGANLSVGAVADKLRSKGIDSLSTYKGGDDTSCQDEFLCGNTNLMVATKAFGMGIDKSNVRLTFHLNYPCSLESFVQEAGRAGRDKKMALATIIYSPKKFYVKNVRTNGWDQFSADYKNNKFFYDSNFLGEEFELYMMELLMERLRVKISNEEFHGVEIPIIADTQGIIKFINRYDKGTVLTYYIDCMESDSILDHYNISLFDRNMPVFDTPKSRIPETNGYKYAYGYANYKAAVQKAIYRMCVIGLIDDFTEDYEKHIFRITTICQNDSEYYDSLKAYYRKYYSEGRTSDMMEEVRQMANSEGTIMACLKHLTSFIYRSIAEKRARGILDMEQFCNIGITSGKDWKDTNEDLKDFIYYYFNSKYAREGFVTFDSKLKNYIPFSLKDDTNPDLHSEAEIKSFELVKKYMRVVDADIVNNDSQKDNVKHLQGGVRLIRRASVEMNPVLILLNIFCILFLGQQENEMLEEEICNDYESVIFFYSKYGRLSLLDEYTNLLIEHAAIDRAKRDYLQKLQIYIQLRSHLNELNNIVTKYTKK